MKTKLHTLFLYPLILIFSSFLKGKKTQFDKFFVDSTKPKHKETLHVISEENCFYDNIKLFFDKKSALYDKTYVSFKINLEKRPEEKKYFAFDFSRVLNIYYTLSMLSARVTNKNIDIGFSLEKTKCTDIQINHLLRYSLLTFASKKVDSLSINKDSLKDDKSVLAYDTLLSYINNANIINFSNAKNLYVLTCKKEKKTFDIIWSSGDEIELTEFNKVYDKYGTLLTKNITISNSPIYALHK